MSLVFLRPLPVLHHACTVCVCREREEAYAIRCVCVCVVRERENERERESIYMVPGDGSREHVSEEAYAVRPRLKHLALAASS